MATCHCQTMAEAHHNSVSVNRSRAEVTKQHLFKQLESGHLAVVDGKFKLGNDTLPMNKWLGNFQYGKKFLAEKKIITSANNKLVTSLVIYLCEWFGINNFDHGELKFSPLLSKFLKDHPNPKRK